MSGYPLTTSKLLWRKASSSFTRPQTTSTLYVLHNSFPSPNCSPLRRRTVAKEDGLVLLLTRMSNSSYSQHLAHCTESFYPETRGATLSRPGSTPTLSTQSRTSQTTKPNSSWAVCRCFLKSLPLSPADASLNQVNISFGLNSPAHRTLILPCGLVQPLQRSSSGLTRLLETSRRPTTLHSQDCTKTLTA